MKKLKSTTPWPPMTNADRIRAMSDEELADYLFNRPYCPPHDFAECGMDANCINCWLDWLKKPAEVE